MTKETNLTTRPLHPISLTKCLLVGAAIALTLITIFLIPVGEPNPNWPKFWIIKPLIIVPLAGATGGLCYYFMDNLRSQGGWKKIMANILSLVIYIIGLWMGTVLGLDGTLWD